MHFRSQLLFTETPVIYSEVFYNMLLSKLTKFTDQLHCSQICMLLHPNCKFQLCTFHNKFHCENCNVKHCPVILRQIINKLTFFRSWWNFSLASMNFLFFASCRSSIWDNSCSNFFWRKIIITYDILLALTFSSLLYLYFCISQNTRNLY